MTRYSILFVSALALAACSGASQDVSDAQDRLDSANDSFGDQDSIRSGGAQVSDGVFVAAQREERSSADDLPSRLRAPGAVTFQSRSSLGIAEIMARLTDITEMTHVAELGPNGEMEIDGEEILEVADLDDVVEGGQPETANGERTMRPNFRGSLPDVLDRISAHFGLDWFYEDDRIVMRDHMTRDYQIAAFAATMEGSLSVGEDELTSSTDYSVDFVSELQETITQLAGPDAQLSLSPSTGIVSVNTTKRHHAQVKEHLDRFNEAGNKQIAFDVNIVNVSRSSESSAGINLTAEIERITGAPTFNENHVTSDGAPRFDGSAGSESAGDVNVAIARRDFTVSSAISALSTLGTVSVETRTGATTLNNRPVPLQVVEDLSYAASTEVSRETTDDGGTRPVTAVNPDTVTVGYQIQLLPRVLNNRDIQVQYGIELSDATFRSFDSGESTIELPEVSRTNFMQQAMVENGQTIVLAGFERRRSSTDRAGGLLRVEAGGSQEVVSTVIFITPRILDRSRDVHSGARAVSVAD